MNKITFISTVHKELGKCNADELCDILKKISPEVIFLEALENSYTKYDKLKFSSYGVYHQKLEIQAMQKYGQITSFEYVPILDNGLSDSFDKKHNRVCIDIQHQTMLDDFNSIASEQGFEFLNSEKSTSLQKKLRTHEYHILNDDKLNDSSDEDIDVYENSMMRNIYSYCRNNQFDKAVFMCGVAHRQSIIGKIGSFNRKEKLELRWEIYGNQSF